MPLHCLLAVSFRIRKDTIVTFPSQRNLPFRNPCQNAIVLFSRNTEAVCGLINLRRSKFAVVSGWFHPELFPQIVQNIIEDGCALHLHCILNIFRILFLHPHDTMKRFKASMHKKLLSKQARFYAARQKLPFWERKQEVKKEFNNWQKWRWLKLTHLQETTIFFWNIWHFNVFVVASKKSFRHVWQKTVCQLEKPVLRKWRYICIETEEVSCFSAFPSGFVTW